MSWTYHVRRGPVGASGGSSPGQRARGSPRGGLYHQRRRAFVASHGPRRQHLDAGDLGTGRSAGSIYPEGTALKVRKGSRLLMEMHYTPTGKVRKRTGRASASIFRQRSLPSVPSSINILGNMMIDIAAECPTPCRARVLSRSRKTPGSSVSCRTCTGAAKTFITKRPIPDGRKEVLLSVPAMGLQLAGLLLAGRAAACTERNEDSRHRPLGQFAKQPIQPRPQRNPSVSVCRRGTK